MVAGTRPVPASGDASFRRYFRVEKGTQSFIVMDAPPDREDCRPFVAVAGYLRSMGLNAPRVLVADVEKGFLLLSDLGSVSYLERLMADRTSASHLYSRALEALATMQQKGRKFQGKLPPYNEELLRFELSLFHDWLCERHLGIAFSKEDEFAWRELCDLLVMRALAQPRVFVHRDYHSRNLMVTPVNAPGILDFQDAVEGPLTYDLVSLLKDCYIRWSAHRVRDWAVGYYDRLEESLKPGLDVATFMTDFELMGVQRHLKAAGIFARLNHRDGKPGYLREVPRTLGYITELESRYDCLNYLVGLIVDRVLPGLESSR